MAEGANVACQMGEGDKREDRDLDRVEVQMVENIFKADMSQVFFKQNDMTHPKNWAISCPLRPSSLIPCSHGNMTELGVSINEWVPTSWGSYSYVNASNSSILINSPLPFPAVSHLSQLLAFLPHIPTLASPI